MYFEKLKNLVQKVRHNPWIILIFFFVLFIIAVIFFAIFFMMLFFDIGNSTEKIEWLTGISNLVCTVATVSLAFIVMWQTNRVSELDHMPSYRDATALFVEKKCYYSDNYILVGTHSDKISFFLKIEFEQANAIGIDELYIDEVNIILTVPKDCFSGNDLPCYCFKRENDKMLNLYGNKERTAIRMQLDCDVRSDFFSQLDTLRSNKNNTSEFVLKARLRIIQSKKHYEQEVVAHKKVNEEQFYSVYFKNIK